jgi:ribosomal protein L37AE/L43A
MKFFEVLAQDFPDFTFEIGDKNLWLPYENKIIFSAGDKVGVLHELGHAICGHNKFVQDIELIHAERDAWDKAIKLGEKYGVKISQSRIEKSMDWYRDWLHIRSTCPKCSQNGVQKRSGRHYECLNCGSVWNTNDGRNARIHRYKQK